VETVRNWARKGVIPAAKLGNRGGFRFRREELDRFLEDRRKVRPDPYSYSDQFSSSAR
jgi:excisionase family DNA binding protein